jgi:hypothetical protein
MTPQAAKLRAGLSMTTLLISATDEELSHVAEPFISVAASPDDPRLLIEYVSVTRGAVDTSRLCLESEAGDVLSPLFLRLWNETKARI